MTPEAIRAMREKLVLISDWEKQIANYENLLKEFKREKRQIIGLRKESDTQHRVCVMQERIRDGDTLYQAQNICSLSVEDAYELGDKLTELIESWLDTKISERKQEIENLQ